jgi:hypothetical protein
MTGIALRESRHELRPAEPSSLAEWADEMAEAARYAAGIAATPFVPASLRVVDRGRVDVPATTANVTAALLTGKEVGLAPMASLRSIVVINGTPAMNALATRALVLAQGHELWLVESTKTRCIYQGRRAGSDRVQESTWTIDRAKDLGLLGKPNWRQQPIAMLIARATAECARLVAPEVLLGLPYVAEELEDRETEAAATAPAEQPPRRTAQRRTRPRNAPPSVPNPNAPAAAPPEDEPPLDDNQDAGAVEGDQSVPAETESEPAPDMITAEQRKALNAALRALGITKRDQALDTVGQIVGRRIESRDDLYRAEASTAIDELTLRRQRLAQADEDAAIEAAYEQDMRAQDQQPGDDEPSADE